MGSEVLSPAWLDLVEQPFDCSWLNGSTMAAHLLLLVTIKQLSLGGDVDLAPQRLRATRSLWAARLGPRGEVPATTGLPRTHRQNQRGERGLPHARSPRETQRQREDDAVLQVLPSERLDVGIDAADLGALGLLQLSLQLLPVCVLHGFDGCVGRHRVSSQCCSAQGRVFLEVF